MKMTDFRWLEIDVIWRRWVRKQESNGKTVLSLRIVIPLACDASGNEDVFKELAEELGISEEEFREYYFSSGRCKLPIG